MALDDCLRSVNLDHLLGTLYEFIETYVKHCPDSESDSLYVHGLFSSIIMQHITEY